VVVAVAAIGACGGSTTPSTSSPSPLPARLALWDRTDEAGHAALAPERPARYVLDGTLADLGATAPVQRLVGHEVSATVLARVVEALGMHGTPARSDQGWELRDGDAQLFVDTSGVTALSYSSSAGSAGAGSAPGSAGSSGGAGVDDVAPSDSEPTLPPTPPPTPPTTLPAPVDVPSEAEAVDLARSLLDRLGVLEGQEWSHDVTDAGEVAVACPADAPCEAPPPRVTARTVDFTLVVDGARVPGVGWSVTIGEHRIIEMVSGTWAQPSAAGTFPLRSTRDVFDDLQHGSARYIGPQPLAAVGAPAREDAPAVDIHISGVTLGLARWDGQENGRTVAYLVPTYRFHARIADGAPYGIELLALDPASFAIVSPPTTPVPEPGGQGDPGQTEPAPAKPPVPETIDSSSR
jgi:hypothetical protein